MRILSALVATALASVALAKDKTGSIKMIVDGTTYDINNEPKVSNPTTIKVVGLHVTFDIDPKTFAITNYTLTGYPNDLRLVTEPTIVFANKTVTLTDAQRAGSKVDKFSIDEDSAEIRFRFSAGKIKYQIKDLPQGGMFQLETELSTAVEHVHTLGETLFYFKNPYTGKVNGGNELPAVSKAEDAVNYHHMLLVKDSPQVANSTFQGSKVSKWLVQPGGRLGGVLGEDATEMGAGATNCTSHCQAQNQIQDGATVPSDPTSDTPLPDPTTTSV